MNKSDLVTSIATKSGLTKVDSEKALAAFIASVEEALAAKDSVKLAGFGSFEVRETKGRSGVCKMETAKGKAWKTEDGFKPVFSASKSLKDIVNK